MMLYAILGCSLFSEMAPESFSRFDRALAALFRIAADDTWVEGVDVLDSRALSIGPLWATSFLSS